MKHPLEDTTIYESILEVAEARLATAAGGLLLPGFIATALPSDEEGYNATIKVSYDTSFSGEAFCDCNVEFHVEENVIKGIAKNRTEDVEAFMDAFLPTYRALIIESYFNYLIDVRSGEIDLDDISSINHKAYSDDIDWMNSYGELSRGPWYLAEVSAQSVAMGPFKLFLSFRDAEYSALKIAEADYDIWTVEVSITWDQFHAARRNKMGLHRLLDIFHANFLLLQSEAQGSYSEEVSNHLSRIDAREFDGDNDADDDPFCNGELAMDEDGRVHSASSLNWQKSLNGQKF